MATLGELLKEATDPKKKKPGGGSGTKITVQVGGQGGNAKDQKGNGSSGTGSGGTGSGSKKTKNPEAERAKTMRDMLKHADELSIFHRQKAAEHQEHERAHGFDRPTRHLKFLHQRAREGHEELRKVYRDLSDQAYRIGIKKPFEQKVEKDKEKAAKKKEKAAKASEKKKASKEKTKASKPATKKKTLKECLNEARKPKKVTLPKKKKFHLGKALGKTFLGHFGLLGAYAAHRMGLNDEVTS
jgi:hypothetical protein